MEFEETPDHTIYTIREMRIDDLLRGAFVKTIGFQDSPVFKMERRNFEEHPEDAFKSYYLEIIKKYLDPTFIIFVAEASYDSDEFKDIPKRLPQRCIPEAHIGEMVIVGIAAIGGVDSTELPESEKAQAESLAKSIQNQGRDKDPEAVKSYQTQTKAAKLDRFIDCGTKFETFVVLKPYRGRGIGELLAKKGRALADSSGSKMAVSSTPMSRRILEKLEFEFVSLSVENGESSFEMAFGVYKPSEPR